MKKLYNFLKYFRNTKIVFKSPQQRDVLVFNSVQLEMYKSVIPTPEYFCIEVPHYKNDVSKLYISFKLLKLIFIEFFRKNFRLAYYVALIKIVKPKLIFTWIDNDPRFFKLAKSLEKEITFCAIQNAWRDIRDFNTNNVKLIYIPHFFCFGDQTKNHYEKLNAKVGKFHIVGSLRQSNAEQFLDKKNLIKNEKKYDICLISENLPKPDSKIINIRFNALKIIAENLEKLTHKYNFKTVLALKRPKNHELYNDELNFYKTLLGNTPSIEIKKKENDFSSYELSYNSKLTIGTLSTMLLETLSRGGKILSCHYREDDFSGDPELNPLFNFETICSINDKSYSEFEKRVLFLLSMSNADFEKKTKNIKNYMIDFDKNFLTEMKIKNKFSEFLR